MSPKKQIVITYGSETFSFSVNLARKTIDHILQKTQSDQQDLIIGMNLVPDAVQIEFYKKLKRLADEYNATSVNQQ